MNITYLPPQKIIINEVSLEFNEERRLNREKIKGNYSEDNQVIQIGESHADIIYQRRDVYRQLNSIDCFFFLGYDRSDHLSEVEIHYCDKISVNDFTFNFNDELEDVALGLSKYSSMLRKGEGEYFFKEIKVYIIDKNHMGGEGSTLGYFYTAEDVAHLG